MLPGCINYRAKGLAVYWMNGKGVSVLLYKQDWEQVKELYRAWWQQEQQAALISVTAPKTSTGGMGSWNNWEFVRAPDPTAVESKLERFRNYCSNTFFGGTAFPLLWLNLGPGVLAAYLTDHLLYDPKTETSWFEVGLDWDAITSMEFDEGNGWWQYTKQVTTMAVEESRGEFVVGVTDLGGIMDVIASLRTTQQLLMDLYDNPDQISSVSAWITDIWHKCFDELTEIVAASGSGFSAWMGLWHEEAWYPIQCDFSALISPAMFERFVLPQLEEQVRRLPASIYHLDGPGELPHLDMLLEIDGIQGIQWVPVRFNEYLTSESIALFKKILQKKNLVMHIPDWKTVLELLEVLPHQGLLLATSCKTEAEAKYLLESAAELRRKPFFFG